MRYLIMAGWPTIIVSFKESCSLGISLQIAECTPLFRKLMKERQLFDSGAWAVAKRLVGRGLALTAGTLAIQL
jgi:hypothetical protein